MRFDRMMDQKVKGDPNQPNIYQQLEMVSCTNKDHPSPFSGVMSQFNWLNHLFSWAQPNQTTRLATSGLARSRFIFIPKSRLFSPHTSQLTSPLGVSQPQKNSDENSFEHFIEHVTGVKENFNLEVYTSFGWAQCKTNQPSKGSSQQKRSKITTNQQEFMKAQIKP